MSFIPAKGNKKMAHGKKRVTSIGNTDGKAPILAQENPSMADGSKPSLPDTGKGQSGTKPLSVAEALSLWQTSCFDLQSFGFRTAILARDNRIFVIFEAPASIGDLTIKNGHVYLNDLPVSDL